LSERYAKKPEKKRGGRKEGSNFPDVLKGGKTKKKRTEKKDFQQ